MDSLFEKTVLITGCSTGIGYSLAKGLRERGFLVIAAARQQTDVDRLQSEGFYSVLIDYSDSHSIQQGLKQALSYSHGKLFALINNGAYGQVGAVEDLPREALRAQFETNLFGWHELTTLVIPMMRRQGNGRIIQISSVLGLVALKYRGAYNASKFALEGLTDTLRLELAGSGIQVSLIEPGPIESEFRKNSVYYFKRYIRWEVSHHRDQYQHLSMRLEKPGPANRFTLPPEAVLKKVVSALESPTANIRYYVTFPTYLFGYLKRILPSRLLDRILGKAS